MSSNSFDPSSEPAGQAARQLGWKAAFSWSLAVLLGVFAWLYVQLANLTVQGITLTVGYALVLGLVHAVLTVVLERSLAYTPLPRPWCYRLAFVISAGLALVHGAILLASSDGAMGDYLGAAALAAIVGSFAGCLAATSLNQRLWEDNHPPSDLVQAEVYRIHQQIIGDPLPIPPAKRAFDICLAITGIILSSPVWLACMVLIWFEDPGPIFFIKNSVGQGGKNFRQYKFRTMVRLAESETGPVWSQRGDKRVLTAGHLLRKTALDELPQLVNILRGEMSFVGPRPQRTVLVRDYLEKMPEYAERHRVLPGLAGLAQVAGHYYLTPRQKLRFDRLYIQYVGLGFDLKLILLAILITFYLRWQPGWDGRLPRKALH